MEPASGLSYCPDLSERIARLRMLYERRAPDRIFALMETERAAVKAFAARYPKGPCECPPPERRVKFWDAFCREAAGVFDDRVPVACLTELDQGLYGGLVGGKGQFIADPDSGWIASMVEPILSDWDELDSLRIDEQGEWAKRYRHMLDVFVEAARGRFGISHFILIDGLNFVFELFGATRTFLALRDRPEQVRSAINFAFDLNAWVQDRFFDAVPLVEGGTCSNMASWLPGRIVSESVDPFHMTSTADYEVFGREPVERILSRYDGGILHLHGNGMHLLEAVVRTNGVRAIRLEKDEPPFAFDMLTKLRRRAGEMPLIVETDFRPFADALRAHTLTGGVLYCISRVPGKDAANRVMDMVRQYRV